MRGLKMLLAIMQGKAVVIVKSGSNKADIAVGKQVSKQFALGSMVGAVKALML
jgi:hypothetical protein